MEVSSSFMMRELPRLRGVWKSYCISDLTPKERSEFNRMFDDAVKRSMDSELRDLDPGQC
jgi:hypothetical protein